MEVLLVTHHAVGADGHRVQAFQHPRPDVGEAHADRTQQPLLGPGTQEVDRRTRQVQVHRTGGLDRVDHEQGVVAFQRGTQGVQVGPKAAPELYRTDRHHPSAAIAEPRQRLEVDSALLGTVEPEFDALSLEAHPGVDVGGKLSIDADDIVTRLPVEAGGHQAESRCGVLGEGDRFGADREQLRDSNADLAAQPFPVRQVEGLLGQAAEEHLHGRAHRR